MTPPQPAANPFSQANLSPLAIPPQPRDLPYGLTWDELRPCLPGCAGTGGHFQAFVSYARQGLHGGDNSCILTIHYPLSSGQPAEQTVFIKHIPEPRNAEAEKYRFLTAQGVPIPRLLADIRRSVAEIIVLEFLPVIGIDFQAQSEVHSLLHLAAQLNAIPTSPFSLLAPEEAARAVEMYTAPENAAFDEMVRQALVEVTGGAQTANAWFDAYQASQRLCALMPLAVCHNQFFFQQVGWTGYEAERGLVLFDLATLTLRPRLADVASVLHPLAVYSGQDQWALFGVYLERLQQLRPLGLTFTVAVQEFRMLRITEHCQSLPWLINEAKEPDKFGLHGVLNLTVSCLAEDLQALGWL